MKRGRPAQFKPPRPAMKKKTKSSNVGAGVGYQAGRAMAAQPKQELKAFDTPVTAVTAQAIAGPPTFQTLNLMVNGAELYQRVGRKCYMKSLHFRGIIQPVGAANETYLRLIIYYDSNPNGANNTIQDLLQDSNAAAATTFQSEINLFNRERFQILRDYPFIGGSSTNIAGATEIVPDPIKNSCNIDFFIPLKGLESVYNAVNGGTIADIQTGALKYVFFGDANAIGYELISHSRVRYYD